MLMPALLPDQDMGGDAPLSGDQQVLLITGRTT